MLIELIVAGGALGVGGVVAAWQYAITRKRHPVEPKALSARGPYRHGESPGAIIDPETGGYPMPPSFDDEGWTPKGQG